MRGRAATAVRFDGMPTLCLTQDPHADQLLQDDPFALLLGMLLDQQMTVPLQL